MGILSQQVLLQNQVCYALNAQHVNLMQSSFNSNFLVSMKSIQVSFRAVVSLCSRMKNEVSINVHYINVFDFSIVRNNLCPLFCYFLGVLYQYCYKMVLSDLFQKF